MSTKKVKLIVYITYHLRGALFDHPVGYRKHKGRKHMGKGHQDYTFIGKCTQRKIEEN